MATVTVHSGTSKLTVDADWDSLEIRYGAQQEGAAEPTVFGGTMRLVTAGRPARSVECVFDERDSKIYIAAADLAALSGATDGYAAAHAAVSARSPVYVYSRTDTSTFRRFTSFTWDASAIPRPMAAGNGWSVTAELTVDGRTVAPQQLAVVASGDGYHLYAPQATFDALDQAAAATEQIPATEQAPATASPGYDYGAVDSYLQARTPVTVHSTDSAGETREYASFTWDPPSERRPLREGRGWTFSVNPTVEGTRLDQVTLRVTVVDGDYRLGAPSAVLGWLDKVVRPAAQQARQPDYPEVLTRLERLHERQSVVRVQGSGTPMEGVEVDWQAMRDVGRAALGAQGPGWTLTAVVRRAGAEQWRSVERARIVVPAGSENPRLEVPSESTVD